MSEDNAARELATAALLSSKLCHDLVNPVGALANGLEVLAEETDAEMRGFAMDLINSSVQQASAKLQFARYAFGAGGGVGDAIDMADAEQVVRNYLSATKAEIDWHAPSIAAPKNAVKLFLNFILIALDGIPYGGTIQAVMTEEPDKISLKVAAQGKKARFNEMTRALLNAETVEEPLSPHSIQAYYSALISRALGLRIHLSEADEQIALIADFPHKSEG